MTTWNTCSVSVCDRPTKKPGSPLCAAHTNRLRRHGDVQAHIPVKVYGGDPAERFWEKVDKTDTCWLWTGSTVEGYGTFRIDRIVGVVKAHRFAYEQVIGPIPNGLVIDHLCRVRHCVNPSHLEPVTDEENIRRGLRGVLSKTGATA